jgi:hypothetical protein
MQMLVKLLNDPASQSDGKDLDVNQVELTMHSNTTPIVFNFVDQARRNPEWNENKAIQLGAVLVQYN